MAPKITKKTLFCCEAESGLEILNADGEVVAAFVVPAGNTLAKKYLALVPPGGSLHPSDAIYVYEPPGGVSRNGYGSDKYKSAANPNFVPMGSAEKQQRRMMQMVNNLAAKNDRLERRVAALNNVEAIPIAPPAPAPESVIEPVLPAAEAETE